MKKRKKLKPYKISRGSFEEQQLREDKHLQTLRALMIILPIVMAAVLVVGIFFAYKGYQKKAELEKSRTIEHVTVPPTEPTEAVDPMMLTVVTPAYPLTEDYVPALADFGDIRVSPDMVDDLKAMLDAAQAAGHTIVATDGYVSYQEQGERYRTAVQEYQQKAKASLVKAEAVVRGTTPREGESEQQTGLLVYLNADTEGKFETSAPYAWLMKNCITYGFVLRYPEKENAGGLGFSPHLFRYVGAENAYFIRALGMTFDEYVIYRSAR